MREGQDFLTRPQVAKRYGVTERSIARWEIGQGLGFPRPIVINRRKFFRVAALEQWERARAATAGAAA